MKHQTAAGPFAATLGCCLLALASASVIADNSPPPVAASWQQHEYTFNFIGYTSTYSCDGLARNLKRLLLAAGARADVKAVGTSCGTGDGPTKVAGARLTFYTLAAAPDAKTSGVWQPVAFVSRSRFETGPYRLSLGDCELVDQFRKQVLPMFTTRDITNGTTCALHELAGSVIDLRFDALAAPPASAGSTDSARRAKPVDESSG